MTKAEVSFAGNNLTVGGRSWLVDYPILQAFLIGNRVIVLYDPDARPETFGQFPNLVAFDPEGGRSWVAQLPTNDSGDCYWRIYLKDGLMADSFTSYSCRIDEASGRIIDKVFYK